MPVSFSSPISTTSPIVEQVIDRKRRIHDSRSKLNWALANFCSAAVFFFEAENHFFIRSSSSWRLFISRLEITFSIVFIINAVLDSIAHFFPFGIPQSLGRGSGKGSSSGDQLLPVSPQQRKLLGVAENDPVFGSSPKEEPKPADKASHPFGFPAPLEGSFVASSTPMRANQMDFHNMSNTSLMSNTSPSVMEVSSWLYYKPQQASPQEQTTPKSSKESKRPTASPEGVMTNENMLREYMASLEAKEEAKKDLNNTSTFGNQSNSVYWPRSFVGGGGPTVSSLAATSSPISSQDYSPVLKKLSYQISSPMPNVVSSDGGDESGAGITQGLTGGKRIAHTSTEHICIRLGIDPLDLASWMQNLRLWISQTILARLVKEIESTNKKLSAHGISDLIGATGVEKLVKCGQLLSEVSTSINRIVPFIEFTVHQDYLVHRICELSRGGAISDYKWNGGSNNFKGQAWSEKYPTDCEIIINCFAAYLDNCMPPNYSTTDGKPFTNVFFVKAPEKSETTKSAVSSSTAKPSGGVTPSTSREGCIIMQAAAKPPYFFLQMQEDKLDVSPGRNNLFHTLILFLHHIKTKEGGILGRINFGVSGINILWIID